MAFLDEVTRILHLGANEEYVRIVRDRAPKQNDVYEDEYEDEYDDSEDYDFEDDEY